MYTTLEDIKFQPQLIDPKAAKSIGRSRAAVLMQMIYWSKKSYNIIDRRRWFYNPIREWNRQISYYSESTIKRAIHFLEKHGFIISRKMSSKKCDHTKWYSIVEEEVVSFFKELHKERDYISVNTTNNTKISSKLLHNKLGQNDQIDQVILNHSITKNTTKTINSSSIENDEINNQDIDLNRKEKKKKISFNSIVDLENTILKSKNCSLYQPKKQERTSLVSKHQTTYGEVQSEGLFKIMSQEKDSLSNSDKNSLTDEEFQSVYAMKEAWNKVFESAINPINAYVSNKSAVYLYKLLKEKFGGDMERWKTYARLVNSSKFLMGEKETKKSFKAQFGWLTQYDVIDKILGGEYGVGDRVLDQDNVSHNIEQQKKMVSEKSIRKISEHVKSRISDSSERAEFNSYLLSGEYKSDGDKYEIKDIIRGRSAEGLVLFGQEPFLYSMLYESYLSKKYIGLSYFDSKEEINKLLHNLSCKNTGASLMEVLRGVSRKIDAIDFTKTQIGKVHQIISA